MKRSTFLSAVISGFLLVGANCALADAADCTTVFGAAGTFNAGLNECQVSASNTHLSGTVSLDETLHMFNGATITVDSPSLTINFTPSGHGLIMDAGSKIDGGDPGCSGADQAAFPITINATGDIDVQGPGPGGTPPGALIRSDGCSGGAIVITTTSGSTIDIDGTVESVGTETGTGAVQPPGGGPITIVAGCSLTVSDTGLVSSRGKDPGADLVHLEGCTVTIFGKVESTGSGHADPNKPANHCNLDSVAHPPGNDPSGFYTGCVEIWSGTTVTINSTGAHKGEVNADIGTTGGTGGRGWIDIYANGNINIIDGPGNDHNFVCGGGGSTPENFAVHSNGGLCQNTDDGGYITIKSLGGDVVASGNAIQANAITGGSEGGVIHVEAFNNVNFNGAAISAQGDSALAGGFGDGGDLGTTTGGAAPIRAFNGALTWASGEGNVLPTGDLAALPAANRGQINLEGCTAVTLGATFPFLGANPTTPATTGPGGGFCGSGPTKATAGNLPAGECLNICGASKSGTKFNDSNANHKRDILEPGLQGWTIKIFDSSDALVATKVTDSSGAYSFFGLLPGSYKVCEVQQSGYAQTCPQVVPPGFPNGLDCNLAPATTVDCTALTGPATTIGYLITLADREQETGNDFGNVSILRSGPPECPEDLPRGALMTRTVDKNKAAGGGSGTAGDPTNYLTIQGAYDAAKVSPNTRDEVIGMFSKTTENVVLDNYTAKSMTITQCTNASATSWDLKANKKLLIIGPDSTGGTIGWYLETGGHELKSIRSNGATVAGLRTKSGANSNNVSFNNVASSGIGIDLLSNSNTLKSGTIGPNTGAGVHIGSGNTSNNVSGMTIQQNGNSGVWVEGNTNTITSNKLTGNAPAGIKVTGNTNTISSNQSDSNTGDGYNIAGTSNVVKDNKASSNTATGFSFSGSGQKVTGSASSQSAVGAFDYRISAIAAISAPSGNKADGISIPAAAKCTGFFTNVAVLTCN